MASAPGRGASFNSAYPDTYSQSAEGGNAAGSSGPSFAPADGTIVRSPDGSTSTRQLPVGRDASTTTDTSTPAARSSSTAVRPSASAPTRPTNVACPPAAQSQAATFAAAPPPNSATGAGVSEPGASGPGSRASTSTIRSPTQTTEVMRSARVGAGDLRGEGRVRPHQ